MFAVLTERVAVEHGVQGGDLHAHGDLVPVGRGHVAADLRGGTRHRSRERDGGGGGERRPAAGRGGGRAIVAGGRGRGPSGEGGLQLREPVERRATTAMLGLVAIPPESVPEGAVQAAEPDEAAERHRRHRLAGLRAGRWRRAGRHRPRRERGLPGVEVEAVADGEVVASTTTGSDGTFVLEGIDRPAPTSSGCRRRTSVSPSAASTGSAPRSSRPRSSPPTSGSGLGSRWW